MTAPYRVVVTVGTDHHHFDRLVGWIDHWAVANPDVSVLVQVGTTAPAPVRPAVEAVAMIGYDDLVAAMAGADVVVAQGGPAAIMDARGVGHQPVVVPRQGSLGEHVDDHQMRFAAWMAQRGLITLAADEAELHQLIDEAIADPSVRRISAGSVTDDPVQASVARFAEIVDPLLKRRA